MQSVRSLTGVVVSAGLMMKTVKVRVARRIWDSHIRKHYIKPENLLVHDPRASLIAGDIVTISPGWRRSKWVHHVVTSIVTPFGKPISERPPVPTLEELEKAREEKRARKLERKEARHSSSGETSADEAFDQPQGAKQAPSKSQKTTRIDLDTEQAKPIIAGNESGSDDLLRSV
ncbi:MAG: hypothetical protein M1825_004989 [Sarcosagium campestre]|nr:MAG: hypothetical protein M1825_004989 [Sarcosagium campestre]